MATSEQQTRIGTYGVLDYDLGDLIVGYESRTSNRLILTECPLCANDPERPRYYFSGQEPRPRHFEREHSADEITSRQS